MERWLKNSLVMHVCFELLLKQVKLTLNLKIVSTQGFMNILTMDLGINKSIQYSRDWLIARFLLN